MKFKEFKDIEKNYCGKNEFYIKLNKIKRTSFSI